MSKAKISRKLRSSGAARHSVDAAAIADHLAIVPETSNPVAELAGVLKGVEVGDHREEYAEYLRKKYS